MWTRPQLTLALTVLAVACLADRIAAQAVAPSPRRRTPVVAAVEKVSPTIVSINTQKLVRQGHPLDSFFQFLDPQQTRRGLGRGEYQKFSLGSGVLVDPKGYVVTNDHVVRQADRITVGLADGRELVATLLGTNQNNDIAVLKLESDGPFPAARLGSTDDLMLGEPMIALGNPFGLEGSVTDGILSATGRTVTFRGKEVFHDFLQTSAVINPGNSGGPLINIEGEVIGINVAIHSRGPGIGFAIPVSRVREVLYNILDPRFAKRGWLGLAIDHADERAGARVEEVDADSPAAAAGFAAGDVILQFDGRPVTNWIDFQTHLASLQQGQHIELAFERSGRTESRRVALAAPPTSPAERAIYDLAGFEFEDLSEEMRRAHGGLVGVVVTRVLPKSGAAEVGVAVGDIITGLERFGLRDKPFAMKVLDQYRRRSRIDIQLYRPSEGEQYRGELPLTQPR